MTKNLENFCVFNGSNKAQTTDMRVRVWSRVDDVNSFARAMACCCIDGRSLWQPAPVFADGIGSCLTAVFLQMSAILRRGAAVAERTRLA